MDIKDLQNAVVYFSFTSKDGGEYAYLYMIVNHKFYWIDENYNVAEPLSQDTIDSFIQSIENGEYDEQYDLDSYDSIDVFWEEFGNEKKELVKRLSNSMSLASIFLKFPPHSAIDAPSGGILVKCQRAGIGRVP